MQQRNDHNPLFSRNKETVLPVFLEVARDIKYMD